MKKEKSKETQKDRLYYYGAYSAAMIGIFGFIVLIFMKSGKSFVHEGDGLQQHYLTLEYWGNYLRQIIRDLVLNHRLNIPQWDLHIGYGGDILTTLHYYVIGDPLNLLAVFVPSRYMEYLYDFLCFLRYYLAGITFSMYCFYNKNKKLPVLLGSLIYVYSQWMIVTGMDHPYFMNPAIYLPLIMLGVDKIFDGKKPYLYIWAIVLSAVSNFYFFYMLAIFTAVYVIFRYFTKYRKLIWKELAGKIGVFAGYTIIALMISSPVLLAIIKTMMGNSRMSAEKYTPILYSKQFYTSLLAGFAGASNRTRFSYIGVASVCVLAVIVLFMQKKKYLNMKLAVILVTAMVCLPAAGKIMNGFSYTTNRWTWAFAMLFAYIFVKMFPEFFALTRRKKIILTTIVTLYALFLIFYPKVRGTNNAAAGIILISFTFLFLAGYKFLVKDKRRQAVFFAAFIIASVTTNIWFYYESEGKGPYKNKTVMAAYQDRGAAYKKCHTKTDNVIKNLPDSSTIRTDQRHMNTLWNSSIVNGINAGKFRFSIAAEGVGTFFNEVYMNNYMDQAFGNLNSRTWLSKLFSIKYFLAPEDIVPYGVVKESDEVGAKKCSLYVDQDSLPLAYTYDSYIPAESYLKMNGVERQEAFLQGVVLEDEDAEGLEKISPDLHVDEISYTVHDMKNMTWEDGVIESKEKNASCKLSFNGEQSSETYITFSDIYFMGKNKEYRTLFEQKDNTDGRIKVNYMHNGKERSQVIQVLSTKNNFGSGRTNFGMNLLYNEEPLNEIELVFKTPGKYKVRDIQLFAQKMNGLSELTEERREEAPEDLMIDGDHISCSVNFSRERELVFSIPYSTGWKLWVDGVEQKTNKANRMFLGAKIQSGSHQIDLHYTTPGLPEGECLALVGLFCLLLIWRKERKKQEFVHKS